MSEWNEYKRKGVTEMRPHEPGEDMTGISISNEDILDFKVSGGDGGMIARNPDNHHDQWFVNGAWFENNYESA